jgi:hypothetical protein
MRLRESLENLKNIFKAKKKKATAIDKRSNAALMVDILRERSAEKPAEKAEVVTISHYHFDHHTPSYGDWLSQWTEPTETAEDFAFMVHAAPDPLRNSRRTLLTVDAGVRL